MQVTNINEDIVIHGLTVRTKNADEMNAATAKIGPLWNKFFVEVTPQLKNSAKVYGFYSNYESDAFGAFDVTASTDQKMAALKSHTIKKGKYLVFHGKGKMPEAVINAWGAIWHYFSQENKNNEFTRNYLTDFELYKSESEVDIYIGIK